jgi:hypothetical protein
MYQGMLFIYTGSENTIDGSTKFNGVKQIRQ